jgi:hypothetical protein
LLAGQSADALLIDQLNLKIYCIKGKRFKSSHCSIKLSDVEDSETLQVTNFLIPPSSDNIVKHLRFTIREGQSDFCAVARVIIAGESKQTAVNFERDGGQNNGYLVGDSDKF